MMRTAAVILSIIGLLVFGSIVVDALPWSPQFILMNGFSSTPSMSIVQWIGSINTGAATATVTRSSGGMGIPSCMLIQVQTDQSVTLSVNDGKGNSYTILNNGSNGFGIGLIYAVPTIGGSASITITATGGNIYQALADEIKNCQSIDGTPTMQYVASTTAPAAPAITTTHSKDLVFGFVAPSLDATSIDPGTGYTALQAANTASTVLGAYTNTSGTYRYVLENEDLTQPSAGSIAPPFITVTDNSWIGAIAFSNVPSVPTITAALVNSDVTVNYTSGTQSGSLGAITVTETGGTFGGTVTLGGTNAGDFAFSPASPTSLPANLVATGSTPTCTSVTNYSITITPIQAGIINSGTAYPITVTCNPVGTASIINANSSASATSMPCNGSTFTFEGGVGTGIITPSAGGHHVDINGVRNDPVVPAGESSVGGWQMECDGTVASVYDLYNTTWYHLSGSTWVINSPAWVPPGQTGLTSIPIFLGSAGPSGPDAGWTSWLGRVPDYADNYSQGYPADGSPSQGANNNGSGNPGMTDMTADLLGWGAPCTAPDGSQPSGNAAILAAWTTAAAGGYKMQIDNWITTYLVNSGMAPYIAYIRVGHEWNGGWNCASPWYGTDEAGAYVPNNVWMGANQVLITEIQRLLLPHNTAIHIYQDGPSDATMASYMMTPSNMAAAGLGPGTAGYPNGTCYQGASCIDMSGTDSYVTNYGTASVAYQALCNGSSIVDPGAGGLNCEYLYTWIKNNGNVIKGIVTPEYGDETDPGSVYLSPDIISNFNAQFASLSVGPGPDYVAVSYWDNNTGCTCGLGQAPTVKQAEYGTAWPTGFHNTIYDKSFWTSPVAMPANNNWQ